MLRLRVLHLHVTTKKKHCPFVSHLNTIVGKISKIKESSHQLSFPLFGQKLSKNIITPAKKEIYLVLSHVLSYSRPIIIYSDTLPLLSTTAPYFPELIMLTMKISSHVMKIARIFKVDYTRQEGAVKGIFQNREELRLC